MNKIAKFLTSEKVIDFIERSVFSIRWALIPMYIGLYIAIIIYNVDFVIEIFHMIRHAGQLNDVLMTILGLVDIIMIAQLVVMTTIGGYTLFVREFNYDELTNKPRWMNNLTSTTQKVKLGMSLMGVTSVHMLGTFLSAEKVEWNVVLKESLILIVFLVVTYGYAVIDQVMHPPGAAHHDTTPKKTEEKIECSEHH